MTPTHRTSLVRTGVVAAVVGLALAGCTNTGQEPAATGEAEDTEQQVQESDGPTCSLADYGGEEIDLADAVVGFSQSEREDNPFRIAETQSIRDAAEDAGVGQLITTNAGSTLSKQISDIQDMIAQGAEVLIVAPLNSDGLEPALQEARDQDIPVLTIDRKLNAEPCSDYVSFLGSDFVEQGRRAADQLIAGTGGEGQVAILLGASGNGVTDDRTQGFVDQIEAEAPGIEIVAQQTGNFTRSEGQSTAEQLLGSNPGITAIYAENDEMGLGAQAAIVAAGKVPGQDVQIYSIDGTRNAVEQLAAGAYNGVIESNPRFGPLAFDTLEAFLSGEPVGQDIVIEDSEYDPDNAADRVGSAY